MSDNSGPVCNTSVSSEYENLKWRSLGLHVYLKIFIIATLFWYVFGNEIDRIVSRWSDPSWSHGFLIPVFSLYFLNQYKQQILRLQFRPSYLGLFLLICCMVLYPLIIVHFQFGYALPLTTIAALGAIVLFLGGWGLVKYAWLPVVYLVFAVPLPVGFYRAITIPMRQLAAKIAGGALNLIPELEASANGVIIDVIYKGARMEPGLDVAEACSGMRLLMAFLALGVAMAYLHYRPVWHRIILLCSTIPIAICCNIVRVTVTGFIYIFWDPMYAQGIYHDLLGMAMLPLAFCLYGCLAWFLHNLFVEETSPITEDVIIRRKQ